MGIIYSSRRCGVDSSDRGASQEVKKVSEREDSIRVRQLLYRNACFFVSANPCFDFCLVQVYTSFCFRMPFLLPTSFSFNLYFSHLHTSYHPTALFHVSTPHLFFYTLNLFSISLVLVYLNESDILYIHIILQVHGRCHQQWNKVNHLHHWLPWTN